jgi:tetratricopeptide (TPR) repeat protein
LQGGSRMLLKKDANQSELFGEVDKEKKSGRKSITSKLNKRSILITASIIIILLITSVFVLMKIFKTESLDRLRSSDKRISIAVMPFQNLSNDATLNVLENIIQESLLSVLSNSPELNVRQKDPVTYLLRNNGLLQNATISLSLARNISRKLDADIFIYGGIVKAGPILRLNAKIIETRTNSLLKSFEITGPCKDEEYLTMTDSLRRKVMDYLLITKILKENRYNFLAPGTNFPEAFKYYLHACNAFNNLDPNSAGNWSLKALQIDSNFYDAAIMYINTSQDEEGVKMLIKLYEKKSQLPIGIQLQVNYQYANNFGSPDEQIVALNELKKFDDQNFFYLYLLGGVYNIYGQTDLAILEMKKSIEIAQKQGCAYNLAYAGLAEVYHKAGMFNDEKKLYKEAERNNPDKSSVFYCFILIDHAGLLLAENDTTNASRYIKNIIKILKETSGTEADIERVLGSVYLKGGLPDKAEDHYRKGLSMDPENPGRMKDLADFFIESNRNLNEVSELMDKAMKLVTKKTSYYIYMDTKGWALHKQGKNREALDILEKTWKEVPFPFYYIKAHLEEVKKAVAGQK